MGSAPATRIRTAPALVVARALARSWVHRPVRVIVAIAGGIGGVLLTTAVLMIAMPVLNSTRVPPVAGVAKHVIAVAARAPVGISNELATKVAHRSGASSSSRLLIANTTVRYGHGHFVPVLILGADAAFRTVLDANAARSVPPLKPDQAYLDRTWARQRHLRIGSRLEVTTPTGAAIWTVAGLSSASFPNSGSAVIVSAPTAAAAFERGTSTDVLLLRPRGDPHAVQKRAAAIVDGAADVVSPNQVFASYARIYRTPLMLVAMFGAIALLVGGVVLFLTWRLALADARPILSRFRLLGVRTTDLLLGSGVVLVPMLLTCYAVGATAGCLVGRSLSSFRSQITNFTGQAFDPPLSLALPLLGGLAAAVIMFGFAWLTGTWQLRRTAAIDAITGRDATVFDRSEVRWPALAGLACYVIAGIGVAFTAGLVRAAAAVPLLLGAAILSAVLPVLAGILIRHLSTRSGGLLLGRQLQVEWRRNAALAITFAIALLSSMAMFGGASSILHDINASNARWTRAQLYVTAAPLGHNYQNETFPLSLRTAINSVPGVSGTDTFSYVNAVVRGGRHLFEAVGGDADKLTAPRLTAGPPQAVNGHKGLHSLLTGNDVGVSSNFARTQHLGVGSTLEIPTGDGHLTARVVAVIDDSVSDGGMITAGPKLFPRVAGPSHDFYVGVGLAPGADPSSVRAHLRTLVARRYPRAQVLTLGQYRTEVSSLLSSLMSSFSVFAWVMFAVAAVVGTATLASSIAERTRAVALTRLLGGRRRSIRNLLGVEAVITVTIAWLVAALGAPLAISAMIAGQSVMSGLLPKARLPVSMIEASLPLAALATVVALAVARRAQSERPLAQLIADE